MAPELGSPLLPGTGLLQPVCNFLMLTKLEESLGLNGGSHSSLGGLGAGAVGVSASPWAALPPQRTATPTPPHYIPRFPLTTYDFRVREPEG